MRRRAGPRDGRGAELRQLTRNSPISKLQLQNVDACVFDAYGTLFDFNSAASAAKDELGDDWQRLSDLWRLKQLQYTWLRGLAQHHAGFWQVTGDALDFALATLKIERPGAHLLPFVERLGRLFGQGLRLSGDLVQPLRPGRRTHTGDP